MCGERKAQGMCDRNGGARRGARPPHVWRAVRDAYSVNSGGRRVERGIVRWKPAARRATRYEQGGSGWVRAAHCARREMNRGRGGERGRCAAEARGARGATRPSRHERGGSGAVRGAGTACGAKFFDQFGASEGILYLRSLRKVRPHWRVGGSKRSVTWAQSKSHHFVNTPSGNVRITTEHAARAFYWNFQA